jgi:hypothetical protein
MYFLIIKGTNGDEQYAKEPLLNNTIEYIVEYQEPNLRRMYLCNHNNLKWSFQKKQIKFYNAL